MISAEFASAILNNYRSLAKSKRKKCTTEAAGDGTTTMPAAATVAGGHSDPGYTSRKNVRFRKDKFDTRSKLTNFLLMHLRSVWHHSLDPKTNRYMTNSDADDCLVGCALCSVLDYGKGFECIMVSSDFADWKEDSFRSI